MKTIDTQTEQGLVKQEVSDEAHAFYQRLKTGEILQISDSDDGSVNHESATELLNLDLIETHARVWETRPCYVLKGFDPRREAVAEVIREAMHGSDNGLTADEVADKILAVL